jgi:alanyl-tRNA synthetase
MNRPSYERDAYLTELDTEIVDSGRDDGRPYAVTSDTILYPEGGGQPADHGTIDGIQVVDVRKVDGVIRHCLAAETEPGPVRMTVDWRRRFDHMQQHTGQHLLTAVALRSFGWPTTAFHLGPIVSDIELDVPSLPDGELRRLEDAVAQEILNARSVTVRYAELDDMETLGVRSRLLPDGLSGEIRLIEIDGLDLNTCGGTHLQSTAEIGSLALLGSETMRGGTRLHWIAGDRVRRRLAEHEARNRRLRNLLDASDDDLPSIIELRLEREKELARDRRRLLSEVAEAAAERLASNEGSVLTVHWNDRELPFLQQVGTSLVELVGDRVALLTAGVGEDGAFLLVVPESTGVDIATAGSTLCEVLDGRGGGRAPFFQGKAARIGSRLDAAAALEKLVRDRKGRRDPI